MIEDLKVPDRKATLRRIPRPPKESPGEVFGKVIDSSSSDRKRPPERGLPSLPSDRESPTPPRRALPKSPAITKRPIPPSPPRSPSPPERLQNRTVPRSAKLSPLLPGRGTIPPPSSTKPPFRPPPRASSLVDQNNNVESDDEETYEEIDDASIRYKPERPPPILPKRNDDEQTARVRLPTNPVPNKRPARFSQETQRPTRTSQESQPPEKPPHIQNRKESNVTRPERIPPPPPPESPEGNGDVAIPPRKYYPSPTSSLNNSQTESDFKNEISNVLKNIKKPNDFITGRKVRVIIFLSLFR